MSKFCVYCGNEMEDNDNACGNCGKLVSDEKVTIVNNVVTPVNQKTEGTAIAGIVISSILFILLIVLYFVGTLTTVIDTYSSI